MEVAAFSEGIRRYEDRDYEMAAGFFRVALDEDPRNLRARLHLAACLHNSGQSEHAFDVAFGGRAFHLTSPALAEVLATLYEARELLPEAIDCLDTAIEGMPHKFEYSIRKAGLLVKLGLHDDARHTLLRSIASNGYQTELVLQLCDTWIDEHDYIRARGVLERCPDSVRADQKREKIYTLERTYEFPMSLDDLEFWRPIHAIRIGNPARRKKFISAYTDVARHLNAIATTTPAAERLRIRVRMKNVAEAEYRARKVMDLTSNLVFWIIFIAGGIALLRFPYILPSINHSLGSPSFKHYVISYGGSIAVGYTLLTILAASPGRHRYLLSFLLSGYVVAIYDLAYRLQFSSVDLSIRFGVAAGLTFVSFAMTISAAGSLLERLARRSFVKRLQDRYPEEYSLLSLLNSLLAVQRAKSPRQELQSPGYLASTIEDAAIKFAAYLKARRKDFDRNLARVHRYQDEGKLGALLELRSWVLLPMSTTLDDVEERIKLYIGAIVRGEIGSLPWVDPQPASRRRRVIQLLLVLRATLITLVPLLFSLALDHAPFAFAPESVRDFRVGALVWAAVTTVIYVDPTIGDKIELFQKVRSLAGTRSRSGSASSSE